MANDDTPADLTSMAKRPRSRKHRIVTHNQSTGNNATLKLPNLHSKSSIFPSTSETMHFKRYRSQGKDTTTSSLSYKIERQSTNMNTQTRLPILHTASNGSEQREKSEFQRRQIYALNHSMRELEQEQFRQFCKLNGIGITNSEEVVENNEDSNKEPST